MKIFTCTPRSFYGDDRFFSRDTGMLCRSLQSHGIDARPVMLLPVKGEDHPDILRADYATLCDPEWWRQWSLDAVVLYAWADPASLKLAKAIREAGIFLIQSTDGNGVFSPLSHWRGHLIAGWRGNFGQSAPLKVLRLVAKNLYSHSIGLVARDRRRARMIAECDIFTASTPPALARFIRFVGFFSSTRTSRKFRLLPLPVPDYFKEEAEDGLRERQVIAVGRWDAPVKRPELLAAVIRICLMRDREVRFTIVGGGNEIFTELQKSLAPSAASRIELKGIVSNEELVDLYRRSRTLICTSAYEGYHISSAEALCSGCSVVAPRHALLPALEWYASRNSGSLAVSDSAESLADALCLELDAWDSGMRSAYKISRDWCATLSASQVSATLKSWINAKND